MKQRRVPLRKCIACQVMRPKKEMIRVVKTTNEEIEVDFTGKKSGRGAYICGTEESVETIRKNRALERALGISIPTEVYDRIAAEIEANYRPQPCHQTGEDEHES